MPNSNCLTLFKTGLHNLFVFFVFHPVSLDLEVTVEKTQRAQEATGITDFTVLSPHGLGQPC